MQVGRELRRAAGEPVVALLVALEPVGEPAARALAGGALTRREGVGGLRPGAAGRRPAARPDGKRSERGAPWTSRRSSCSHARWKGVKTVYGRTAPTSATNTPGCRRTSTPLGSASSTRRSRARRERRHVGGEVERARAALARERRQLVLGPPCADDEVGAALAQRGAQLGEAAVQEPRAVGGREAACEQPRVEHEDRHDAVALAVRRGEAGVVVHAQVAPEPDEGGRAHSRGTGRGLGTDVHSGRVDLIRDFPLFPLGLVALPTELVPLHIFEERYKTMVARVLEEEGEFGIVWVADDGLREIGCACEIAEILERMPDGRINLVARGTRPFRIEARQDELAYPAGTIEFLEDEDEPGDPEAAGAAHEAYAELVVQATDHTPGPGRAREHDRLRDGRDRRLRPRRQAGPARSALRGGPPRARRAAVPRRAQAAGLRRARPGPRALERPRALPRLTRPSCVYPVRRGPVARTPGEKRRLRLRRVQPAPLPTSATPDRAAAR